MENKEKIIEKINKLFILAENNANASEKRAARAKAYQLMNEYDIDDAEVPYLVVEGAGKKVNEDIPTQAANEGFSGYGYAAAPASRSLLKNIFGFIFEVLRVPLVWQSIFVIIWINIAGQLARYQAQQGHMGYALIILGGSFIFLWPWVRNFLFVSIFFFVLYLIGTTGWDYLVSLFM